MNKLLIDNILNECNNRRENVKLLEKQTETMQATIDRYEKDIEEKLNERMLCEKASAMFKRIANDKNKEAKKQIEEVLNYALNNIPLEKEYIATIEESASSKSGREMIVVLTERETGYQRTVRNQTGTLVAQLVSFILTLIVIKFSGSSRLMILDEVFTGMEDYDMIKVLGNILVSLAKNEDYQIFMIEHRKELDQIDEIYNIPLALNDYEEGTVLADE